MNRIQKLKNEIKSLKYAQKEQLKRINDNVETRAEKKVAKTRSNTVKIQFESLLKPRQRELRQRMKVAKNKAEKAHIQSLKRPRKAQLIKLEKMKKYEKKVKNEWKELKKAEKEFAKYEAEYDKLLYGRDPFNKGLRRAFELSGVNIYDKNAIEKMLGVEGLSYNELYDIINNYYNGDIEEIFYESEDSTVFDGNYFKNTLSKMVGKIKEGVKSSEYSKVAEFARR